MEASAPLAGGRPALLRLDGPGGAVVFAAVLRDDPPDVTTPYGYGGPVAAGPDPPTAAFGPAYEAWCADRAAVSTFVVFHPLFANHRYAPPAFRVEPLAGTVAWALDAPAGPLAGVHPHHRRQARRAQRAGVTAAVHERPPALDDFVALYEQTMRRRGARGFYLFPPSYWAALRDGVPLARVDARRDGELVASLLCLATPPWLHYHLGGSSEAGRALGANHLLFLTAAAWAAERGYTRFHLGGGVGGREDSLLAFKQRFAPPGRVTACVGKAIHDPARYRALSGGGDDRAGFFPAYRSERSS